MTERDPPHQMTRSRMGRMRATDGSEIDSKQIDHHNNVTSPIS